MSDPYVAAFLATRLSDVEANPGDADSRGRLAMAYEMNDFEDTALVAYRQAEALDVTDFRWPYFQATLMAGRGESETALAHLRRALAIDPGYAPAWLRKGALLRDLGRNEDAAVAFRRARELGEAIHADIGLAHLALRQNRPAEALALIEGVNRDHPQVFRLLGRAYQALGRPDDARIAMARGKDPQTLHWDDPRLAEKSRYIVNLGGLLALAETALRDKNYETAAQILTPLRIRYPDDKALLGNLAIAYARTGRTSQAHDVMRHAFSLDADHAPFHNAMATVLSETGNADGARHHLVASLRLNPTQAWAHERLGRMLMANGEFDEALAAFEKAVRYGIRQPEVVLHLAGSIEGSRENWQQAINYFERAVALDESLVDSYIYLGICLAEVGTLDEAEKALAWAEKLGTRPLEVEAAKVRLTGQAIKPTDGPGTREP